MFGLPSLSVTHDASVDPLTGDTQQGKGTLRVEREQATVKLWSQPPKGEESQKSFLDSRGNFSQWS